MFSPFHSLNIRGSLLLIILFIVIILLIVFISLNIYKINLFNSLCLSILVINLRGLLPYFWCFRSYIWGNLILRILLWFCFFISPLLKSINFVLSHFLPIGSPIFLWYFLISLEIVRQVIRPLTLRLRLICNIIAGHVLISLIRNLNLLGFFILRLILFFEIIVSIIQSLVYSILNFIYKKELS